MAAGASNSGSHSTPGQHRESLLRRTGPLAAGDEHLPQVLAEAVGAAETQAASPWAMVLTAEDRQRLVAAVARHPGTAALDVGLVADLVQAVLPESLAAMVVGDVSRRRLAEQIARSLLEDPRSCERLQALVTAIVHSSAGQGHAGGAPPGPRS